MHQHRAAAAPLSPSGDAPSNMLEPLKAFIERLKQDQRVSRFSEAATKQAIILPLLQHLGWDTYNIDEVTPDFPIANSRIAYALRLDTGTAVFLNLAQPGEEIESLQKQLLNQSYLFGVKLAISTNGLTWWFFLPLKGGEWSTRLFYVLELAYQDASQAASKLWNLLSKEQVLSGKAERLAESLYSERLMQQRLAAALPEAWNSLITEPSKGLLDSLAAKTEQLCGFKPDPKDLKQFLSAHAEDWLLSPPAQEDPGPLKRASLLAPPVKKLSPDLKAPGHKEDRAKPCQRTEAIDPSTVRKWAERLAADPRFEVCQTQADMQALLKDLAGQALEGLPAEKIVDLAGVLYFLNLKPNKDQQLWQEVLKLQQQGLTPSTIAQRLGITQEQVKRLLKS